MLTRPDPAFFDTGNAQLQADMPEPYINAFEPEKNYQPYKFFFSFGCVNFLLAPFVSDDQMSEPTSQNITVLLRRWSDGDASALEELTPIIYDELRRIARRHMARERSGHTLQTTALVNEAFVRLMKWSDARFDDRKHFFGVSAHLMRMVLVDFARKQPRSGNERVYKVSIDEASDLADESGTDLVALDEALKELAVFDQRKCRIVELKFFGGLKTNEIAELLNVSEITVLREWKKAKAWLYRTMTEC